MCCHQYETAALIYKFSLVLFSGNLTEYEKANDEFIIAIV